MNNKRKEFLNRLLRISELNQEIAQNNYTNRQPVYTKRIKIMQVGQCQIRLPDSLNPQKHNCQILVLSNTHRKHISHSVSSSKTIPQPECVGSRYPATVNISPQISTVIPLSKQFKQCIDKKRASLIADSKRHQDINFVSGIRCQAKITSNDDFNQNNMSSQQRATQTKIQQARNPLVGPSQDQSIKLISQISAFTISPATNENQNQSNIQEVDQTKCQTATISHSHPNETRYFKSSTHINYFTVQKSIEEEKRMKLSIRKQVNKNYGKPFIPPPKLSAKSYIVCEIVEKNQPMKMVVAYNSKNSQQVASLTKIMTCIVTVQFCEQNGVNRDNEEVKIGKYQSNIGGTSAELRQGQIYTVNQLLHGLMLPSGNDASLALAVWCGRLILAKQRNDAQSYQYRLIRHDIDSPTKNTISRCLSTNSSLRSDKLTKGDCYARFIREMNDKAKMLKMIRTRYMNSHGLINVNNRSTAYDIALLSEYAMRNATFRSIVGCPSYEGTIKCIQIGNKTRKVVEEEEAGSVVYNQNQIDQNIEEDTPNLPSYNSIKNTSPDSSSKAYNRPASSTKSQINCVNIEPPIIKMNIRWQNTHRLLHSHPREYIGIKTGFTTNAGPCLSSCLSIEGRTFLIVVLGCAKMSLRFKETQTIKKWLLRHEGINKQSKRVESPIKRSHREVQKQQDSFSEWQEAKPQLGDQ